MMSVELNKDYTARYSGTCVHELFEQQVERTPDSIAVVFNDQRVTYAELNQKANQLAHYLQKLGVGPEVLVGICVERSLIMVIGLLGILKAGGAYVPLDPAYPHERLRFMLEDAAAPVFITQRDLLAGLPSRNTHTICLDDWETIGRESDEEPHSEAVAENLSYVIYTSGSTGKPKGVAIQHQSVAALVNWASGVFSPEELQGVLASTSICFDLSVFELFVTLSLGGCVILADDALHLANLKAARRVTLVNTVPSAMTELLRMGVIPESVRTVNLAGEPLKTSLVKQIHELRHVHRVFDLYGPSEDTTYSTFALRLPDGPATIGRPISNTEAYLLDSNFKPVLKGMAGEIYLGGQGLARGYLNRPDLTAERFVPNPFSSAPSARLYRTGDLARYLADGDIEYLGRVDHQVKIRGYRIELGEIETVVSQHAGVRETLVMAREDEPGDRRLVAYVVPGLKDSGVQFSVNQGLQSEQISQWQAVWDETYREKAPLLEPGFNIVGWNSSYTGEPIDPLEMKQWVDHTVERILSLRPRRVLEIGCGTGLLLFRIAPDTESYHGTDLSQKALDYCKQQIAASSDGYQNVTFSQRVADDFADLNAGAYDTVILNSVVQYFPSVDYLVRVLEGAAKVIKPGGSIFLGDLRTLRLMLAFHTSVQLHHAPPSLAVTELRQRAEREASREKELAIDSGLFAVLKSHLPQISRVEVQLKRGRARNEFTKFRYDVILHVDKAPVPRVEGRWLRWPKGSSDMSELRRLLEDTKPEILGITGLLNARVSRDVQVLKLIASEEAPENVADLQKALEDFGVSGSVEPEDLWALGEELGYEVELKWGAGSNDECDLVLRRSDSTVVELAPLDQRPAELKSPEKLWSRYANNPPQAEIDRNLVPELRRLLKEKLPEHMMPSAFVLLSSLPLTANGKIDRGALLPPCQSRPELETAYVAPQTPAEEMLATIWREVLKLEQIGVNDNFFHLGGHSLVAVRLFAEIENKFGIKLPLSSLFEASTISQLATILQRGSPPSWSSLVPIQPQGTKHPLFCVHACGAHVFIYRPLVAYLGTDQPVYGLQAQGINGTQEPYSHIEDMAAHYIREIRDLEPHGPYYLVGDTLGGLIAFEIARQLERQGEDVALLAMFDTFCPLPLSFGPRVLSHLSHLKQLGPRKYLLAVGRSLARKLGIRFSENLTQIGMSAEEQDYAEGISASGNALQRTEWAIYLATHVNYRPPPQRFPGRLTYFLARDNQYAAGEEDDRRRWKRWAAEFELHVIPGRHSTISDEPDVAGLAEKFISCLDKTQAKYQAKMSRQSIKEGKRRPGHSI
jgi:amino acid adenylation domain-containing protein